MSVGARNDLRSAAERAAAGDLDGAARALRAYFAVRYTGEGPLTGVDADAAMLAATCALLRGDRDELAGVATMLRPGYDDDTKEARDWTTLLGDALAGRASKVFEGARQLTSPALEPLVPAVLLCAAEHGLEGLAVAEADALRRACERLSAPMRARAALVAAAVALRAGDRAGCVRALAEVPADAPPLYRLLSAVAREDFSTAGADFAALPADARAAAASFIARLVVGAPARVVERAFELVGGAATPATRAGLAAGLAAALAREGQVPRARRIADEERSNGGDALTAAAAYVALSAGDPALALDELRELKHSPLRLLALALAGDAATLAAELPAQRPRDADALAPAVLATLARTGAEPEGGAPTWLVPPADDPAAQYAWAVLELRRGRAGKAHAAFTAALAADPALAARGDAPDVARLALAREALAAGDLDAVERYARPVESRRLVGVARRLRALSVVRRHVGVLDPAAFDALVARFPTGSEDRSLLELLAADLHRLRARRALRAGHVAEARGALGATHDRDGRLLQWIASVLEGAPPDTNGELERLAGEDPSDALAGVLLAELRGAVGGAEARVAALEALRGSLGGPLVEEATAMAYGGARRGLDAKRVALAEVRRLGGSVPPGLAAQLNATLALEVPPAQPGYREGHVRRAPAGSLLSPATLRERVDVLLARAAARPELGATLEPLLTKLKRAVVSGDETAGAEAEREIIGHLGRRT